ncbi:hypothetical protein BH23BAC1_BH23BAC1_12470 [soil metagenome]
MGCENNNEQQTETQAYQPAEQEAVADLEEEEQPEAQPEAQETEVEEEAEAPARTTYQPRITRSSDKLTLDATHLSFSDLDENNNYIVSREELLDGIFNTFDTEEGNTISEEEFNNKKDDFFINKKEGVANFSEWDADGDGEISREEFHAKLNSMIDLEEGRDLPQSTYIVWDLNNDDNIDMLELENFVIKFEETENN